MRVNERLDAGFHCVTLPYAPRRICVMVSSAHHRSTRLIQDP
jgi:hypothetical protein